MGRAASLWILGGTWLLLGGCAVVPQVVRTGGSAVIRLPDRSLQAMSLGPGQGGVPPRLPVGAADGLAQDGNAAWLLEGRTLFRWEPSRSTWVEEGPAVVTASCLAMVPTTRGPVCIGPDRVFRPGDGARWNAPSTASVALQGPVQPGFGPGRVVAGGHAETVVVGTSQGARGAVLWSLDTRTGTWSAKQFAEALEAIAWWRGTWLSAWTDPAGKGLLRTLDLEGNVVAERRSSPAPICALAVDAAATQAVALSAGEPRAVGPALELVGVDPEAPGPGGARDPSPGQDGWCSRAGALLIPASGPLLVVEPDGRTRRLAPSPPR